MDSISEKKAFEENGFSVLSGIYSGSEIGSLIELIGQADASGENFRKSSGLFAIRRFFDAVPGAMNIVFNKRLRTVINAFSGADFFVVKSIYFDKPEESNWFVAWHQDLMISVDRKMQLENFGPWTVKQGWFSVQPPVEILENNLTIRIHLDDTDERNGALNVISGSHLKKVYRPEQIDWSREKEVCCDVPSGGIMLMKPLLLHRSSRTINAQRRRVIHIEFSNCRLPDGLAWAEMLKF